jgi:hypothetical protein
MEALNTSDGYLEALTLQMGIWGRTHASRVKLSQKSNTITTLPRLIDIWSLYSRL